MHAITCVSFGQCSQIERDRRGMKAIVVFPMASFIFRLRWIKSYEEVIPSRTLVAQTINSFLYAQNGKAVWK